MASFSARSPGWKRKRKWLANRDFRALHCLGARLPVSDEPFRQGIHPLETVGENRMVETTRRREEKGEWRKRVERTGEGGGRMEDLFRWIHEPVRFGFVEDPRYSSLPIREPFHKKRRAFVCIARKDLWAMSRSWTESLKVEEVWWRGTKGPRHPSPFHPLSP